MSINSHLVKAIVDMFVFLEYTNSERLDEDTAVEAMEQFAAELNQMTEGDRQQLAKQIIGLSSLYEQPQSAFVERLPEVIGLA